MRTALALPRACAYLHSWQTHLRLYSKFGGVSEQDGWRREAPIILQSSLVTRRPARHPPARGRPRMSCPRGRSHLIAGEGNHSKFGGVSEQDGWRREASVVMQSSMVTCLVPSVAIASARARGLKWTRRRTIKENVEKRRTRTRRRQILVEAPTGPCQAPPHVL
jgi:hypothetical protein